MKQAIYMILVGLCLLTSPRVQAQGFTPSKNYQAIQYNTYSASGLHLQSDALERTHTSTSAFSLQQGGRTITTMQVGTSAQPASLTAHPASLTTHGSHSTFGVGAWQGQVTSVGGDISEASVVKRNAIGGGGNGKPNNPTYVPIGATPWLLLSLLALAYALCLSHRARKD